MTAGDDSLDLLAVFGKLLRLSDAERSDELAELSRTNPEYARELESLLAHTGDDHEAGTRDEDGRYLPGVHVDAYRIERFIGAGGMGEVYEATEIGTVSRRVALKVMASDVANRTAEIRFAIERQAMAMLEHAGVARLFGGGVTEERRPYLVMEHIDGLPLLEACDAANLGLRDRLELMAKVCDAVHHAHLRGIVHRDLTPWNILTRTDADGGIEPVVIDFGVAKAMVELPGCDPFKTMEGREPGTPAYMSPEQLNGDRIGPASDVFSLGVILHELLAGAPPIPRAVWQSADAATRRSLWRTHGVPSLVGTFDGLDEAARTIIARDRRMGVTALRQALRSDLAAIPAAANAGDPEARYGSASAMAADLRAAIDSRPLEALRHRRGHRIRTFIRRHRGRGIPVALAGIVAVSMIAILAYERAALQRQQDLGVQRLEGMLETYDLLLPEMSRLEQEAERQAIARIVDRVDAARSRSPDMFEELEPGLSERLGVAFLELGRPAEAELALRRVIDRSGGLDAVDTEAGFVVRQRLISAVLDQDRPAEALALARRTTRNLGVRWGRDHGLTNRGREQVASIHEWMDEFEQADRIYAELWGMIQDREASGVGFDDWPEHHTIRVLYAASLIRRGERTRPEAIMRREILSHYRYEPDGPGKWNTLRIFGDDLETWGEYAEALAVQREVLRGRVRLYGEDGHPTCDSSRKRVARLEARLGLEPGEPIPGWPDESVSWNPPEGRRDDGRND